MILSIAEEMNPTRRNNMEDAHVVHEPGTWGAPNSHATFLGVYDGHGGRFMAEYLEENLAGNVAQEWHYSTSEQMKSPLALDHQSEKKRRLDDSGKTTGQDDGKQHSNHSLKTALERAFLLTDVQSRMDGITTSGATAVCCVVIPHFSGPNLTSISIHAANVGDARAVLSSCTSRSAGINHRKNQSPKSSKSKLPNPELPNELPVNSSGTTAVRITQDHKSTDPKEIARVEASGGIVIRGRVLGVLAVARSLGDHGLKEYVIGRPYVSSTVVRIQNNGSDSTDSSAASLDDGEFLIVACDGLWDTMEDQEAVDFVRNYKESRNKVATALIEEALQRGSTDNITVIVYWLMSCFSRASPEFSEPKQG